MEDQVIRQKFEVRFNYPVHFTEDLFSPANPLLAELLKPADERGSVKLLPILDQGMEAFHPDLSGRVQEYLAKRLPGIEPAGKPIRLPGGEEAKNRPELVERILDRVETHGLDRHSYIMVIGGGAVIDAAGYAASVAHRGIRLLRIPTTVLAQNDAAVGVKNGVNAYGKKNFLGTFSPPYAVLNDSRFLETLDDRDWRSGISEAVKVALIRDASFFRELEERAESLAAREMVPMRRLVVRCAELHLNHIATSGDPFETGSSRPLDFGHWAAHKLEQLTDYRLRHGEAVAIGITLDACYSHLQGNLERKELDRILILFETVGFRLFDPVLEEKSGQARLLEGLEEFREHLGGELTIMLLKGIGEGMEVNQVDHDRYREALDWLASRQKQSV